ncbi:MAG TPA: F0F1 ATP synthase subunit A [Chloroflexia bacterium]|nr:F0F1 ATP synthase subunit A [Chloroflexia bacterium]
MPEELEVKLPEISIKAEPVFPIDLPWGGQFVITNSMVYTIIVIAALALFFWWATRRMSLVPKGKQNFAEAIVEFLLGVTEGTAGRRVGRRIFPLIATLFIFIITANYAGLLPGVGTIGYCTEPHHEEAAQVLNVKTAAPALAQEGESGGGGLPAAHCTYVDEAGVSHDDGLFIPYLRAPNADINTTLAMALLAVGIVQIAGIAAHGIGGYAKELLTPLWLAPIHIVGELSRVISLSFRLFGNIFGGEVLVTVMYVLLGSIFIGFGTFIFLGLELLFGFIQALVFSTLTLVYIATAVGGHGSNGGHGHGEEAHAPAGPAEELGHQAAALLTGRSHAEGEKIEGTEPKSGTERHMS